MKLNGKKRTISFRNKSVEEIDRLSFPRLVPVKQLSDKELAVLLEAKEKEISAEIVKKARQELAQTYHEIKFLKNPDVREFQKTGIKTAEYEAALAIYLKGKK